MGRVRIRRLTIEQEKLVAMTQVWVIGHPRELPNGKVTWVDGYWRNQRPGEDLTGKITKPGTAYTAKERKARGIKFEPPPGVDRSAGKPPDLSKAKPGTARVVVPGPGGVEIELFPGEVAYKPRSRSPNAIVGVRHTDGSWTVHYVTDDGKPSRLEHAPVLGDTAAWERIHHRGPRRKNYIRYEGPKDIDVPLPPQEMPPEAKYKVGQRVFLPASGHAGTIVRLEENGEDNVFRDGEPVPGSRRIYRIRYDDGREVTKAEHVMAEALAPRFNPGDWVEERATGFRFKVESRQQNGPASIFYELVAGYDPTVGRVVQGPSQRFRHDSDLDPSETPVRPGSAKWKAEVPGPEVPTEQAARQWTALAYLRDEGIVVDPDNPIEVSEDDEVERHLSLDVLEARWEVPGTNLDDPQGTRTQLQRLPGLSQGQRAYYLEDDPEGVVPADFALREAKGDAIRSAAAVESLLGRKSRWTGRVRYEESSRAVASVSWHGTFRIRSDFTESFDEERATVEYGRPPTALNAERMRIITHEMTHSVSSNALGGIDPTTYSDKPAYEEGVVEGWTRSFLPDVVNSDPELRALVGGRLDRTRTAYEVDTCQVYGDYVRALRELASLLGYLDAEAEVPMELGFIDARRAARSDGYRRFFDIMLRIPLQYRRNALFAMASASHLSREDARKFDALIAELDKGKPL